MATTGRSGRDDVPEVGAVSLTKGNAAGSEEPPVVPGLPVAPALGLILLVIGAITMGETDRLVTGALTPSGESRSVTGVIGVGAWGGPDTWSAWLTLPEDLRRSVAGWIFLHARFDIV
jgi:hypothetical protein